MPRLPADTFDRLLQLLAEYGRLVDAGESEAWADLFATGGGLVVRGRRIEGTEALRAFAADSPAGVHITGIPSARIENDLILARTPWTFVRADGTALLAGHYEDRVVDDGTRARFAAREVHMIARMPADDPS